MLPFYFLLIFYHQLYWFVLRDERPKEVIPSNTL